MVRPKRHRTLCSLRFSEGDGNDKYNTRLTPVATHTGVGHDFSTARLIEQGGDATYNAAGLVLGSGNDNGYGFLIHNAGEDTYTCPNNNSLGNANSPNPDNSPRNLNGVRTLGLFLDAGGNDTYKRPDMTLLGNNQSWLQGRSPAGSPRRNLEHGVGLDGEGSSRCSRSSARIETHEAQGRSTAQGFAASRKALRIGAFVPGVLGDRMEEMRKLKTARRHRRDGNFCRRAA